jgi:hypothetical protein
MSALLSLCVFVGAILSALFCRRYFIGAILYCAILSVNQSRQTNISVDSLYCCTDKGFKRKGNLNYTEFNTMHCSDSTREQLQHGTVSI